MPGAGQRKWAAAGAVAMICALGCGGDNPPPAFVSPVTPPAPASSAPVRTAGPESEPTESGASGAASAESGTVVTSASPAPPQSGSGETAAEGGPSESETGRAFSEISGPAPSQTPAPSPSEENGGPAPAEDPPADPPATPPSDPEEGNPRQNIPCDQIQLPAPTVSATFVSPNSIRVSWSDVRTHECEGDISYEVSGPGLDLTTTSHSATATGLAAGEHCYTVDVVGGGSGNDCETVPPPLCDIRTATINGTPNDCRSGTVTWTHKDNGHCDVRYNVTGAGLSLTGTTLTSAPVTGLQPNEPYRLTVRAYDGSESAEDEGTLTTPSCPTCDITSAWINADPDQYTMDLTWGHRDNGECSSVSVTYTVTGGNLSGLTNTSDTSATDRSLRCQSRYRYEVTASGGGDSADADTSATTDDCDDPPPRPTPMPPSGFAAEAVSSSVIELSWDSASGADSYEYVRREGTGSFPPDAEAVDLGAVTEYEDSGLPRDTEYCYRVRTVDGSRKSGWTAEQCATTLPPTPGGFDAASASATSIEVSWDSVSGVDIYELQRKEGESGSFGAEFDVGSVTSYVDGSRTTGTTYCYRGRTVDGSRRSAWTGEACATPRLEAPENFEAEASSDTAIDLRWDAVSGADSYEVRYRETDGARGSWSDVGSVTRHAVSGLEAETGYEFEVRTVRGTLRSGAASASATTEAEEPPATPENVRVVRVGTNLVEIAWDAVEEADGYDVEVVDASEPDSSAGFRVREPRFEAEYFDPGSTQWFRVQALRGTQSSARSGRPTVTTAAPAAPATLAVPEDPAGDEVALRWSEGSGAGTWDGPGAGSHAIRYTVERRAPPATTWEEVATELEERGWTDGEVSAETRYEYRVTTTLWDPSFVAASDPGVAVAVLTGTAGLAVPANLAARAVSSSVIELSWDEVEGATGYRLRRRLHAETAWEAEIVPDSATAHRDRGLLANTQYCYGVRALGGDSVEWSDGVCRRTKRTAPANLRVRRLSRTSATLAWDGLAGNPIAYVLYGPQRDTRVQALSYQQVGLTQAQEYEFEVTGLFGSVETERSGTLSVTTADPTAPGTLDAAAQATEVSLSWEAGPAPGRVRAEAAATT